MKRMFLLCCCLCIFAAMAAADMTMTEKMAMAPKPDAVLLKEQIHTLKAEMEAAWNRGENPAALREQLKTLEAQVEDRGGNPLDEGGEDCANAVRFFEIPYCDTGNTCDNENDYNPPTDCAPGGAPDVVYIYSPTQTEVVTFSLCGSDYNTVLHIWRGCPGPNGVLICCNNNFCELQSCCPAVTLVPGEAYYIVVDGLEETCGDYVFNVTYGTECPDNCGDECPFRNNDQEFLNDECGTINCQFGLNCPDTLCGEIEERPVGSPPDFDWYCIQIGPGCTRLVFDVYANDTEGWYPFGGGLDPRIWLYAADCETPLDFDDDSGEGFDSHMPTDCLPAGFYFIRVEGFPYEGDPSTGPYVLTVNCDECPCDGCEPDSTVDIHCWPETILHGNTCNAGNDCPRIQTEDYIWEINITQACQYEFDMCAFWDNPCMDGGAWDSWLILSTVCCPDSDAQIIAQNDDGCFNDAGDVCFGQSHINCIYLTPGTYYLIVEGFPWQPPIPTCGEYEIRINCCCNVTFIPPDLPCDMGDLPACDYPTLFNNPGHGLSGIAWLGPLVTPEPAPAILDLDVGDDGVIYWNLPWTPCTVESVSVMVTPGPFYTLYLEQCCGCLFLNGWKDGNLDGDFCDTLCATPGGPLGDEWIVQDVPVTPGIWTFSFVDPGVFDMGTYDGVFRWRLTSMPVGREGFGLLPDPTGICGDASCGTFDKDWLGEVEDYIISDAQLFVELTNFDAIAGDGRVTLRWTTESEENNDRFELMRDGTLISQLDGAGTTANQTNYQWIDENVINGRTYHYTLFSIDLSGHREELATASAAPAAQAVITEYALHQNYPNPFNPETEISFDLVENGLVNLAVYDLLGRKVATILDANLSTGQHRVTFRSQDLPSGLYFYRLTAGEFIAQKKMVILK